MKCSVGFVWRCTPASRPCLSVWIVDRRGIHILQKGSQPVRTRLSGRPRISLLFLHEQGINADIPAHQYCLKCNSYFTKENVMADTYENKNPRMVTGLFNDRDSAERAYNVVAERGYTKDDVNLIMSDETRNRYFAGDQSIETELGSKAAEGAGIGAGIGGALGAIAAAVAAVGTTLALPGLGLVIAGPLAAAIAGAGAGAATGGIVGALIGWGIPEERIKHYEEGIKNGGIL